ncbi:MAG: TA system VapC family ribonuclease toxin [Terracidiphilus sp.]|jgi:toxin-antitoxin system PIN domain toxin
MTSLIFPDINVWVALHHEIHVHHSAATRWFASQDQAATFVFCRQTQMGFFRLMTTEAILGVDIITQRQCWSIYDRWTLGGKAVLAGEPKGMEAALRLRTSADSPSPKTWMDAYLAAFAETANLTLATFDRSLSGKVEGSILLG